MNFFLIIEYFYSESIGETEFFIYLIFKLLVEESSMQRKSDLSMAQEKLKMKECLAEQARRKGMESTYSNYREDIDILKEEIQQLKV